MLRAKSSIYDTYLEHTNKPKILASSSTNDSTFNYRHRRVSAPRILPILQAPAYPKHSTSVQKKNKSKQLKATATKQTNEQTNGLIPKLSIDLPILTPEEKYTHSPLSNLGTSLGLMRSPPLF